ncbi:MAG: FAD-binding protein [Myxococcota bacterium]
MASPQALYSRSEAHRSGASTDYGRSVSQYPLGVLFPKCVGEIEKLIQHAAAEKLPVTVRGRGHSVYGQAQIAGGVVIDTRDLNGIRWSGPNTIDAQPGALWLDVAKLALQRGLTPPVVPDVGVTLTVGGMLSVGGQGETSHRHGALVDNLVELEVVTGRGDRVVCSPFRNRDLFDAVRAGMGQCGVIVRARLKLIPAPKVTATAITTTTPGEWLATLREKTLANEAAVTGSLVKTADGWQGRVIDTAFDPPVVGPSTTYFQYLDRNTASYQASERNGDVLLPHPNMSFSVPADAAPALLERILKDPEMTLGIQRINASFHDASKFGAPLLAKPASSHAFQLRLNKQAAAPGSDAHMRMLAANRQLMTELLAMGAKVYLPYAPPPTRADLVAQYGDERLRAFADMKKRFDPAGILGQGALAALTQ